MNRDAFEESLRAEGYVVLVKELEAGYALGDHEHAWDVKGLVLEGRFTIEAEGTSKTSMAGEHFELSRGIVHTEFAGSSGARLLLGRRH